MKLLFVHENLGDFGGAETFVELTSAEMVQRGHTAWLLHGHSSGRNESHWREIFKACFRLPQSHKGFSGILEEIQPDLVFVNNWADMAALEPAFDAGIPVVRMIHDHSLYCMRGYKYNVFTRKICTRAASPFCVFPCLGPLLRNKQGWFPLRWASYAATRKQIRLNRRCTAVLAYSEYQKRELIANGFRADQVHLTSPIRLGNPEGLRTNYGDRNLVLFAGQVIRGKGVDALLRALAKLTVPFECIILGDGNHKPKCEQLSKSLGLDQRVVFQGYVSPGELQQYYLQATVFAVSSLWPEPFGMVGPEAMRYGLPVVAFDAGAIGEWLKDGQTGFLVPWNDTTGYARKVESLLRDKNLARRLGEQGINWVDRFEPARQVAGIENLFQRLCSRVVAPELRATPAPAGICGI